MNPDNLDLRLARFRSRRDEHPEALAFALIEAGRAAEALEVVQAGLTRYPDDAALFVLEGRARFELGDLPQAQAVLIRAAKQNPRDKEPYRWLAQVLMMRGDHLRAMQLLDRALTIDPDDRALQQAKGRAERLSRMAAASVGPAGSSSRPPLPSSTLPPASAAPAAAPPTPSDRPRKASAVFGRASGSSPSVELKPNTELKIEHFERDPDTAASAPEVHRQPVMDWNPAGAAEGEDDEDAPTVAAEMPREVRSFLEAEGDLRRLSEGAQALAPASFAVPASESGLSLEVHSADLSEISPRIEPPGQAESPEAVLAVLKHHGVFVGSAKPGVMNTWVPQGEAERGGQRLSRALVVAWLVAGLSAAAGYFGFNAILEGRRVDARELVTHAAALSREGSYPSLLAAERDLASARALDPKSDAALEALVFVHAARALEDASGEVGYLQASLVRAADHQGNPALLAAGAAVVAAYEGKPEDARAKAGTALETASGDARVAYLVGRLYARAGREDAAGLLAQATKDDPALALAWLAQGELARERRDRDAARAFFQKARGPAGMTLRAELWILLLDAETVEPVVLETRFSALQQRIAQGSRSERLLATAVGAEISLRKGDRAAAKQALSTALDLSVRDPELMFVLAERALHADEPNLALRAGRAAMTLAPTVDRYRSAYIDALLQLGDGDGALSALGAASADAPGLALVRARAALLSDASSALEAGKKALSELKPVGIDESALRAALLARIDARLGASPSSLLPALRTLAQRSKTVSAPQLAIAELALLAQQPKEAEAAAQRALVLVPDDADALTLLGRAQRMQGDLSAALATLEKAVRVSSGRKDAQRALGSLLLDSGDTARARAVLDKLARSTGQLRDRLGAIEAQALDGDLAGATGQYAQLGADDRERPLSRLVGARIALLRGQAGAAVTALEPLVDEDADTRTAESLTWYGDALYDLGRLDQAATAYTDALTIDASFPEALLGRGLTALRAEKLDQAAELLTRSKDALRVRARSPLVRARAALLEARLAGEAKEPERMRDLANAALALPKCPAEAHFWLAEALSKLKDPAASASYERYLRAEPDGPYAARAKRGLAGR
jgi:tetratricopeptide (TPR) repeat protein